MSEVDQRKVDALIDEWREVGTRNPVFNRLRHMTEAELASADEADRFYREQKHSCSCYPKGFVSTPRAVKERMKAEHIAAGVHEGNCPLARRPVNAMYNRDGDVVPPSYTQAHARREAEAERVEYGRGAGRFRQTD
jgi:hypothetical protein